MAVVRIRRYGEKILRKKTPRIDYSDFKSKLPGILSDMWETMEIAHGIGLAAPQIGLPLRLAIVDAKPGGQSRRIVLINPEIIEGSGDSMEEEGCLSIPGYFIKLRRYFRVRIRALDEAGVPIESVGEGILARAFQHEIDHLDGKLIIDRLPFFQRQKALLALRNELPCRRATRPNLPRNDIF